METLEVENIRYALGPEVLELLEDPHTRDVLINPDGRVFVDHADRGMSLFGEMTGLQRAEAASAIAGADGSLINRDNPILDCTLAGAPHVRVSITAPPIVDEVSIVLRRLSTKIRPLAAWTFAACANEEGGGGRARRATTRHSQPQAALIDRLTDADDRRGILIVGATGSGKTTFLASCLDQILEHDPIERVVILEQTAEIACRAQNLLRLTTAGSITLENLVVHAMRQRPDRIVVGEVRSSEALEFVDASTTGHEGGLCTTHAGNAHEGLDRLARLARRHPRAPSEQEMHALVASAVGTVVTVRRVNDQPQVVAMHRVCGWSKKYQLETLLEGDTNVCQTSDDCIRQSL